MKYVIINGSPRKKNTWKVVKHAKTNLKGEYEEIHLAKENIPMCNGCFNCILKSEEKCPHFDKINPIVEKMKRADCVIIASPVYAMNVSGLLKNFFDHTAYFYHRPEFFDKKALVAVTTAGAGQKKVANYIDETLRHWGFNKVYKISIACGGKDDLDTSKIDKTSKKLYDDLKSGKLHSPKFMDIIFYNAWRAMSMKDDGIEADVKFWHETGLVNHEFSPKVKLGIIKKAFAKIIITVLKRVL